MSMYSSLHVVLRPLIQNAETGTVLVRHDYGGNGRICLREGSVEGIEAGGRSGAPAARELAAWLSFSTDYSKSIVTEDPLARGIDTAGLLDLLGRIDRLVAEISRSIPGNDAVFKTIARKLNGERSFTPRELQVVMALDGKRTVRDIVTTLGLPEFEVLYHISNFCREGFVDLNPLRRYSLSA